MADRMIPSTTEGKTWAITIDRDRHTNRVYGWAIEGVVEDGGRSFVTEHPGSRTTRYLGSYHRLTQKARRETLAEMAADMHANGLTKEA